MIGDVAMLDLKNVVQVRIDGIVFKKKQNFDIENLIVDNKTTGNIKWNNVHDFKKIE